MSVFDSASAHTVRLVVWVTIPLVTGDGWTWAAHPDGDPVGHEYVYSAVELSTVLRVWGRVVAQTMMALNDRFSLTAHDALQGDILGRDAWVRDRSGILLPHGEPWCVWDEQRQRGLQHETRGSHVQRYAA